jgi:methyl-accepting chemotaxis protein
MFNEHKIQNGWVNKGVEVKGKINRFGIGKKLSILLIVSVIVVVTLAVGFSILEFADTMQQQAEVQAAKGVEGLSQQIGLKKAEAEQIALMLSNSQQVINGLKIKDSDNLKNFMDGIIAKIGADYVSFTDGNGELLYETDSIVKYSNDISDQEIVETALAGDAIVHIEKGVDVPLIISAVYPVTSDGRYIHGTVKAVIRLDSNDLLDNCKSVTQTDLTIFCDNMRIATTIQNNGVRVVGTELDPKIADIVLNQKNEYSGEADILGQKYITFYSPILNYKDETIGVLFAGKSMEQFNSELNQILLIIIIISAATIIFVAVISILIVNRSITRPIQKTSNLAKELASGHLDFSVNIRNRDEIGELNSILERDVKQAFKKIEKARVDIDNASDQVAAGTRQLSDGSQLISSGATEQASSLEVLTSSVALIAEQATHNAESASIANRLSLEAKTSATQGNELMQNMQQAMETINKSSLDISKIIKVIEDIAFQTNILALNAAVEAAHAGAHGKGFAVVAQEVRNLAAKSADAANETTVLIQKSIENVGSGTDIANKTAVSLKSIVGSIEEAVKLVGEIASSSDEQANAVKQINSDLGQLAKVVQTNSATAQQTAASSEELSSQAELLKSMVILLKIGKNAEEK